MIHIDRSIACDPSAFEEKVMFANLRQTSGTTVLSTAGRGNNMLEEAISYASCGVISPHIKHVGISEDVTRRTHKSKKTRKLLREGIRFHSARIRVDLKTQKHIFLPGGVHKWR